MRRPRKSRSEPACPRCGNEEDLWEWLNGTTYCVSCLACPHGNGGTTAVCSSCVRRLYSVMTFEGPRIVDVDFYVDEALSEYSLDLGELQVWTYDEQNRLSELYDMRDERPKFKSHGVTAAPPHHRFTSSGGSR